MKQLHRTESPALPLDVSSAGEDGEATSSDDSDEDGLLALDWADFQAAKNRLSLWLKASTPGASSDGHQAGPGAGPAEASAGYQRPPLGRYKSFRRKQAVEVRPLFLSFSRPESRRGPEVVTSPPRSVEERGPEPPSPEAASSRVEAAPSYRPSYRARYAGSNAGATGASAGGGTDGGRTGDGEEGRPTHRRLWAARLPPLHLSADHTFVADCGAGGGSYTARPVSTRSPIADQGPAAGPDGFGGLFLTCPVSQASQRPPLEELRVHSFTTHGSPTLAADDPRHRSLSFREPRQHQTGLPDAARSPALQGACHATPPIAEEEPGHAAAGPGAYAAYPPTPASPLGGPCPSPPGAAFRGRSFVARRPIGTTGASLRTSSFRVPDSRCNGPSTTGGGAYEPRPPDSPRPTPAPPGMPPTAPRAPRRLPSIAPVHGLGGEGPELELEAPLSGARARQSRLIMAQPPQRQASMGTGSESGTAPSTAAGGGVFRSVASMRRGSC
ncbi:hypothetical protein HYH03_003914 [Edaphochlamys debaryana]|uniref:Uncharacterized protein n=1 Tax=Edaphochlamys debaryana TaxID=47281 RepID=A0A835YAZ8_9CHLO|nr:hypothetical protein HYH03_003914 [Edaphochlamys debaryana]|eukprot:KAG2498157.1 hypothetical protein HYH03_003914 [Edaphochlamys debaryana]